MKVERLLEIIGIEKPADFEFYENFADLVESDEEISTDALVSLFLEADALRVSETIEQYFYDMLEALPDDRLDVHILLENIKLSLMGLLRTGDDGGIADFAEELNRFKRWYSSEPTVDCRSTETGEEKTLPLRDAMTLIRLENLGEEEHVYDFTRCLEYELDDYIMSFAHLAAAEEDEPYESGDDFY